MAIYLFRRWPIEKGVNVANTVAAAKQSSHRHLRQSLPAGKVEGSHPGRVEHGYLESGWKAGVI